MYRSDSDTSDDFVSVDHHTLEQQTSISNVPLPPPVHTKIPFTLSSNTAIYELPIFAGQLLFDKRTDQSILSSPLKITLGVMEGVNPADAVKFINQFTTCVFNIASILPTKWERMQLRLLECVSENNESSVDEEDEEDWRSICDLLDERDRMLQYLSGSTDMLTSVLQVSHAIDNKPLFLLCCKLFGERVRHGGAVSDVHHPWAALGRGGGGYYHDDNNSFHNNGSMAGGGGGLGPLPAGGDLFSSITSSSMAGVLPHPNNNKGCGNSESNIPTQSPQDGLSTYFSSANDTSNVNATDFYGESFTSSLRSSLGGFNSFKSMANQMCGLYQLPVLKEGNDPGGAASLSAMLDVASALTQTGGGGDVIVTSRHRGVVGDSECCIPLAWHQLPSSDCTSPTTKTDSLPHSTFLGAAYNFPLVSLSNVPSSVDGMLLSPTHSPFDETANIHNTTHLATTIVSTSSASQARLTQLTQVADMVRSFGIDNTRCFQRLVYPHHQEQHQDDDEGISSSSSSALPVPRGGKQRVEWKQHASIESPVVGCGSNDGNNQSGSDIPKLPPLPPANASPMQQTPQPIVTALTVPPSTSINRCGRLVSLPSTQLMVSLVTSAAHTVPDVTHRPPTPPTTAQVSPTAHAQASPITFTRGTTVDVHGYIKAVQDHITHGILRDRLPENEADRMVAEAEALMAHAPKGSGLVPSLFSLRPWDPVTSSTCPSCKSNRSASSKSSHCRICGKSCCANCCRNRFVGPQDVTVVLPQDKVLEKRNKVCEACYPRYERHKTKWDFLSNALLNSGLSLPELYILRPVNEGWRCATDYIFFRLRQHFRSFTPVDLDTASPDLRPLLLQSAWALSLHSQPVAFLTRCICWPLLYDAFTAHQITTTCGNIAIHESRFAVPDITAKAFPIMSPCGPSVTSTHTVHKRLHAIAFKVLLDTCDAKLLQSTATTPKAVPFEPSLVGCTAAEDKMPASWYGVHLLLSIRDVPVHPRVRYTLPERRRVIIPVGNYEALENKLSRTMPTVSPVQLLQDRCVELIASGVERDPSDPLLIALAEGHIPVLFDLLSCPDVRRPAIKALLRLSKASSALQVRALAECAARVDAFSPAFGDSAYVRAQKQERTPSQSYIGGVLKYVWTPNAFFGGSMRRWVGGGGASSNDLRGTNANEAADNEVLSQWQDVASKGGYYAWTRDASLTSPDDNALSFTSVRSALDRIAKRDIEEDIHTTTPVPLKHFFAFSTDHMSLAPPLLPQLSQVPHEVSPIYSMLNGWHRGSQTRKGCYHGLRPAPSRLYPCDDAVDPKCSETASPHAGLLAALVKLGYDLERVQNRSIGNTTTTNTTTASSSSAADNNQTTTTTAVALQRMLAFLHLLDLIKIDEAYSPSIAIAAAPPRADANIGNTSMESYWKKAPSFVPPPCSLYELLHTDRHGLISINNHSGVKILARKLERGMGGTIGSTSSLMESGPTSPDRVPSTSSTLDSQLYFNQKTEVEKFKIRLVELMREFGLTNEISGSQSKTPMGAVERIEGTVPYGDFPVHPFVYPFSRDPVTPTLITSIRLSDIKKFNSVQAPWRLSLVDEAGVAHPILYKRECLRSDMVVVRSIDALIQLLHKDQILESPLPLPSYQVVPIGAESGIIEMVQGKTLKDVLEGHNMSTASRSTHNESIEYSLNGPRLYRDDMTFTDSKMKMGPAKVPSSAEAISVQRQAAAMCGKMKTSDMELLALAAWNRGADPKAVSSTYLGSNPELPPPTSSPTDPPPPMRGDVPRLPLPACVATLDCFAQVIRPTLNPFITFLSGIVFDRCKTRFSNHIQAIHSWFVSAADEFAQQGIAGRTEAVATSAVAREEKDYHKFLEGRLNQKGNGFPPPLSNHYQQEEEIKVLKQFIASVNFSVLTNYIFGLGDRHESNVMFDPNGARFHIDFGYLFGHRPTIEDLVGMKSVRFEPVLKDAIVFALTFLDTQEEHKNWLDDRFRLAINGYNETAKSERKSRVPFMLNRKSRSEASNETFLVAHMQKCFVPPPTQPFGSLLDEKKFKSNTQSQHTNNTTVPHTQCIWPSRVVTLSSGMSGSSEIVSYCVVNNTFFKDVSTPLPVPQLSDEVFKGFLDNASRTFAAVRQRHHIFDTIGTHLVNCGAQKGSPVEALVASTAIHNNDVQRWQTEADKTQNGEAHDMGSILDEAAVPQHSPKRPVSHRTEQNQCIETTWARGSGWGCGGVGECDLLAEAVTGMRPFGQSHAFISQMKKNEPQRTTSLSYTRYVRSPFLQTVVSLQRPYLATINPSTLPPITQQQPLLSQLATRTDPGRHARLLQDVPDNSKMHREWDDAACDPTTPLPTHGSEPTYFQKVLLVGVDDTEAEDHYRHNLQDSVSPTLLRDALNKASTTVRDTVRGYV